MNLGKLRTLSFVLAASGLFLIYLFSPNQQSSSSLASCSGQVALEANVSQVSIASNGMIATIYQNRSKILVFLKDAVAEKGDRISVIGKASKFSNQCWIFPERVEVK